MGIRMAKLTRTPTGHWTARKVIPEDVRDVFGKREDKPTWPASLTSNQAKAEFAAWLTQLEDRIAAARARSKGEVMHLSQRQSRALAGKWYQDAVTRFSEEPGDAAAWEEERERLYPPETAETYEEYRRGTGAPYEGPWRPTAFLSEEADKLLAGEGLSVSQGSRDALLADMADLYVSLCNLMIQRARGDYAADPISPTLPDWQPVQPTATAASGATIMDLFEGYVAERKPAPATVKAWKRIMEHLVNFVGHSDASRLTPEDIIRWKDHLLKADLSAKTVREKYLAAAKAVFGWAKENRKLASNPATEIKVRGAKRQRLRDPGFTEAEAKTILSATLRPCSERMAAASARARRWVPWLCAYTGARVNEITQLRKEDLKQEDGVWIIRVTPEAGSVKDQKARSVPLHSHLIEQGFVDVVKDLPDGPIFYDPKAHRGGSEGNPQYKKVGERLAQWVRGLGVDDPNVQPNHGWRHRFKTAARSAGMDPEAREVIPGHAPASEGQAYGSWNVADLSREIEKLPSIPVK